MGHQNKCLRWVLVFTFGYDGVRVPEGMYVSGALRAWLEGSPVQTALSHLIWSRL